MIPYLVSILINQYTPIGNRVYAAIIPQNALFPALRISESRMMPDGTKELTSQLDQHSVLLDLFSHSYKEAHELSALIRTDLDRKHQQPSVAPFMAGITVDSVRDGGYEPDKRLYHRIIDLTVYTKPIPKSEI